MGVYWILHEQELTNFLSIKYSRDWITKLGQGYCLMIFEKSCLIFFLLAIFICRGAEKHRDSHVVQYFGLTPLPRVGSVESSLPPMRPSYLPVCGGWIHTLDNICDNALQCWKKKERKSSNKHKRAWKCAGFRARKLTLTGVKCYIIYVTSYFSSCCKQTLIQITKISSKP